MTANDRPLIPRKVLFGNPDRAAARLSPDGRHLAFLAPLDGVLNVWVAPADRPAAARPVTKDTERGIRLYFWAYTNRHVLYLQDRAGDENWRVYRADVETGETRDLTPIEGVHAEINAVSHRYPDCIIVGLNERDARYHDLYRLDILTGRSTLVQLNPGFAGFTLDDDYRVRFAVRMTPDGGAEYLQPSAAGEWTTFMKVPLADAMTTGPVGFTKDGHGLYLRDSRGRNTGALYLMDLRSGERQLLAADDRVDVSGIMRHPTEKHVEAVTFEYLRRERRILDDSVADDFAHLETVCAGDVSVVSRSLDDRWWIAAYLVDDGPERYYLYDRAQRQARFLFCNQQALEGLALPHMHPVVVKSRDGLDLVCYLTLPLGSNPDGGPRPTAPLPMVLDVHGGPWGRDAWGRNPMHHWLADRGYAVMSVNFRGSTGFGKAFVNAGDREWGRKMHDDLIDAVRWAVAQRIADPQRVAIFGASYGGYAVLVGMTFTPEVFACGVDLVGPSNLVTLLKTIPPYWAPMTEVFTKRVGDHRTEEGRRLLEERSPLNRVAAIRRPLLIGQGANDPRVKRSESDQIVAAMKAKRIPVTYALYPDEGHGMARPENRISFYAVAEAFLAEHLGGRAEPVGEDFRGASIQVLHGAEYLKGLPPAAPAQ